MSTVYLSLGSNLGDRELILRRAVSLLAERAGKILRLSAFHETAPWGFSSDNMFVNAAVSIETSLSPRQLLVATQAIEKDLGRTVKSADGLYHDRPIDIDILLYDNMTVDEPDLKIPHPLMNEREFVMIPLREIMEVKNK